MDTTETVDNRPTAEHVNKMVVALIQMAEMGHLDRTLRPGGQVESTETFTKALHAAIEIVWNLPTMQDGPFSFGRDTIAMAADFGDIASKYINENFF